MKEHLYDAEGRRVAKGTIQLVNGQLSCDTTHNGFTVTASYILSPGGQQLTEITWGGGTARWSHTNVWAAGAGLIATYSADPDPSQGVVALLDFQFGDWLGTRRVLTDYTGNIEETCDSLPYGNGETCAPTPTEHLFTGKERDAESGNDYFGARYYSSDAGRFLTPDWAANAQPVPYADLGNPQSLNLYAYVFDDPVTGVDLDGHQGPQSLQAYCGASWADGTFGSCAAAWQVWQQQPWDEFDMLSLANRQTGTRYVGDEYVNFSPTWNDQTGGYEAQTFELPIYWPDYGNESIFTLLGASGAAAAPNNPGKGRDYYVSVLAPHRKLKKFQNWVLNKLCSTSPEKEVESSFVDSSYSGIITGGLGGAFGGGILTDGPGGVPGGTLGAWVGGVVGGMNGIVKGSEMAVVCSAFHVY